MTGERVLVDCDDVGRVYGSGSTTVVAVSGVSCQVLAGDRIAVVGRSGSGKSTLVHLMGGLETPSAGRVSWPALRMRRGRPDDVGVVFQGLSLLPALDVTENVALPLVLSGVSQEEATERAMVALAAVRLTAQARAVPEELSGGQSQRAAIARVLAAAPALVLADEPTGQLDHETARTVLDALLQTVDRIGAALVVSTHDPMIAERLQVQWEMRDGQLRAPAQTGAAGGRQ
ncbi:MAG: transporter ATP-binding protein [Blastococcus sp.]|nr:transporter ATP-binding protein [Blastococcus sp.]